MMTVQSKDPPSIGRVSSSRRRRICVVVILILLGPSVVGAAWLCYRDHMRSLGVTLEANWNVRCLAFSPDGEILAAADNDKEVKLWEARSAQLRGYLSGHT